MLRGKSLVLGPNPRADAYSGNDLGIRDAGYYALDALRIEAGRRTWGAELGPDENPFEAGLTYAVDFNKPATFTGKQALLVTKARPLKKKLIMVVLSSSTDYAWGGEGIIIDDENVGELTSVGWSPRAGACVGLGYVRSATAQRTFIGVPMQIELWGERVAATAWDHWPPQA